MFENSLSLTYRFMILCQQPTLQTCSETFLSIQIKIRSESSIAHETTIIAAGELGIKIVSIPIEFKFTCLAKER